MKFALLSAFLTFVPLLPSAALALEAPSGPVVLTVTGKSVSERNGGDAAVFDLEMLKQLSGRRASMETPWTNGVTTFEGPYVRAILEAAGASGKTLRVKALNDYSAEVPIEDATTIDSILAFKMNDAPMSIRDKGPLFMIYPFDLDPGLYNEKYFSRSVWQIKEIEVID
jgi:hypothetical protein